MNIYATFPAVAAGSRDCWELPRCRVSVNVVCVCVVQEISIQWQWLCPIIYVEKVQC